MHNMVEKSKEELGHDLVIALGEVVTRSDAQLKATLERLDLTGPLSDAVWVLDPARPAQPMKDLAARLHCDPSSATFLVNRLTTLGLVDRVPDANDRRSTLVTVTKKGRRVRAELIDAAIEQSLLSRLSQTDQRVVLRLLRKALSSP